MQETDTEQWYWDGVREKKRGTPLNYFSLCSSYLCDLEFSVFGQLWAFHGLLYSCYISDQREYRYHPVLWSREWVSVFVWLQSLFKSTCLYAFRSAHFREGFRRVLTTCWKPAAQDDDIQWFRSFFLSPDVKSKKSWGPRTSQQHKQ